MCLVIALAVVHGSLPKDWSPFISLHHAGDTTANTVATVGDL